MLNLKKSLLTISTVLAIGASTATLAAYGVPEAPAPAFNWYIGGFGGLTYTLGHDDAVYDNPNWDVGAHFGYRWDPVRIELEYVYQRSELNGFALPEFEDSFIRGHVNVNAAMANVLYDINIDSFITPYIGFGLGYAAVDSSASLTFTDDFGVTRTITDVSPSDSRFAYQALAGIGFKVMDSTSVNIGYRYFGTSSGDHGNDIGRWQNNLFNVGVDYYFW